MIKLYSLILTEDEIKLFSERIERYFSFRDDSEDEIDLGELKLKKSNPIIGRFLGRISKSIKKRQDNFLFYDVYKNGKNIGSIQFDRISNEEIEIPFIEISEKYQGNHYATRILKWAIDYFRKRGIKKIHLDAAGTSIYLYKKLGFKEIKQISKDDVWGGLIHMELKL